MAPGKAPAIADYGRDVWVTGLGFVSSVAATAEGHWRLLGDPDYARSTVHVDEQRFAPYTVHPLTAVDYAAQIPNKADLRQMGPWQCLGTYAAGLALADADIHTVEERADVHLNIAAGNGERDATADRAVLDALSADAPGEQLGGLLNMTLQRVLRPTLYLAELSNLLAGNISIVHGVTASSRTFKGEEMAGVSAVEDAVRRIQAGTGDVFLVGGACNAERGDLMLNYELSGLSWKGPHRSVWQRAENGGGVILGSLGAFLVLEAAERAIARGRRPYAKVATVKSANDKRTADLTAEIEISKATLAWLKQAGATDSPAILAGASGASLVTRRELAWIEALRDHGLAPVTRGYGTALGHAVEAQFPAGLALAALALSNRRHFAPFDSSGIEVVSTDAVTRAVVTTFGCLRGEGVALLEAAQVQSEECR